MQGIVSIEKKLIQHLDILSGAKATHSIIL